ncbi:unnamed protein product [Rangifer tarandus platyrhynchus]|uniref:Uncharacterized protein n=1 Tax=Rangifer tarandus platyrhynchus TaxID=3082113 RepID=A0AC59YZ33_RANTA
MEEEILLAGHFPLDPQPSASHPHPRRIALISLRFGRPRPLPKTGFPSQPPGAWVWMRKTVDFVEGQPAARRGLKPGEPAFPAIPAGGEGLRGRGGSWDKACKAAGGPKYWLRIDVSFRRGSSWYPYIPSALLMALETQVQVQNAQKMSARLWTWLGKEALDAKVAHVPGPQCLRVAMTLPPEPEGRTLGERPWQDDLPSPDPEPVSVAAEGDVDTEVVVVAVAPVGAGRGA